MKVYSEKEFSDVYADIRESIKNGYGTAIPDFSYEQLRMLDDIYEDLYIEDGCDEDDIWDVVRYEPETLLEWLDENWKEQEFISWDNEKRDWKYFTIKNDKYDPEADPNYNPDEDEPVEE